MSDPVPVRPSDPDLSRLLRLAGPRTAAPADAAARVRGAVHARWQRDLAARRRTRGLALAAALVASALAASFVLRAPQPAPPIVAAAPAGIVERITTGGAVVADGRPLQVGDVVPAGALLETATGRAAVRLQGVSMRLDRQTRVRVVSSLALELEQGGVYLDSGDVGSGDLRIVTREGEVRELGTQFQVRSWSNMVEVRVREGYVILTGKRGRFDAPAGARLEAAHGEVKRSEDAGYGAAWSWIEEAAPDYTLEGRTLEAFLRWVSRETGLQVRFAPESLAGVASATRLHGSTRGLTPSEAIDAVVPPSGLRARREGGTLWISRSPEAAR
jgi:ferric-dicitrate binding protein FerR (iron transport regulator)